MISSYKGEKNDKIFKAFIFIYLFKVKSQSVSAAMCTNCSK